MTNYIYIIRGGPASGKTTLAPLLAKKLKEPIALLEQDMWRWDMHLAGRTIPDVDPEEHLFADELFVKTIESYLAHGRYTIIVEGSFGWEETAITQISAKKLAQLGEKYGFHPVNIVLKSDFSTQSRRNLKRHYVVPRDEFKTIYDTVYDHFDQSEHIIDTSGKTIDQTLDELYGLTSQLKS